MDEELELDLTDQGTINCLSSVGVDIFDENRNYWLVRTKGGDYFEDFYLSGDDNIGYVGIEWNEITEIIDGESKEELSERISKIYPKEKQQQWTYIAGIIIKFINEIKKGDIVLIPSAKSKTIAFGEILDDEIYLAEENEDDQSILDIWDDLEAESVGNKKEVTPMKKRRRVKWFKHVSRQKLDPDLRQIIYMHQTIVDLSPYAQFVDRTLSDFYIKGEDCYFTYRVNKPQNIPYMQMSRFLSINDRIIEIINSNEEQLGVSFGNDDLVLKINVQSKGPVQFKGPMKKLLIFGLVSMLIFGGKVSLSFGDGFSIECGGLPTLIDSANKVYANYIQSKEYDSMKEDVEKSKQDLELQVPDAEN